MARRCEVGRNERQSNMLVKRTPVSYDFSTLGGYWANPATITYSIVPDGTVVSTSPTVYSDLYAKLPTGFYGYVGSAAEIWTAVGNIRLELVTDDGSDIGSTGGSYGNIRVCGSDLGTYSGSGMPAGESTGLTTEGEGRTGAAFISINTNSLITWSLGGETYDFVGVMAHEFGHTLGLGHSTYEPAIMYPDYVYAKSYADSDDAYGIQSVYGPKQAYNLGVFNLMLFNGSGVYPYV